MYILYILTIHVFMELVNVRSTELGVKDATSNDVERGYYYLGLVDHSKLRTQLMTTSGVEVVHDVGSLLLYPVTKLGILQESLISMTFSFANYSC